jgi:hypothetical protein
MTSADTQPKEGKSVNLKVQVDTGMGDTDFAGFIQVGKKILMEVWDEKTLGRNEFLGEVYINDLEECREMYDGAFPLQPATTESINRQIYTSYTEDKNANANVRDKGANIAKAFSPPESKDLRTKTTEWFGSATGRKDKTQPQDVQGELNISARWVFPELTSDNIAGLLGERPKEVGQKQDDYDEKLERLRNTGRLSLSIRPRQG